MELLDIERKRHQVRMKIEEERTAFEKMDQRELILSNLDTFFNDIQSLKIE
ncbi:uncharacterized protein RHIMIDRAFT_296104 [Rhizopus microsporus ATCC 52813]|uniref:Uncharacterized protein n=1 Tax=Rhizopus microsporus ATCC 52813 TaxID=1340429 RepID=A0A2G4SEJ9_RHIZD|nr:uncharacterized protein RHIMIDRAFT_296104 [Rhizopus microsporus ATCC 52813]PHZ07212.1 hypothetical protein RHIMIDRAFT_296104 [Rhizopus microsporus ATCC 52813]